MDDNNKTFNIESENWAGALGVSDDRVKYLSALAYNASIFSVLVLEGDAPNQNEASDLEKLFAEANVQSRNEMVFLAFQFGINVERCKSMSALYQRYFDHNRESIFPGLPFGFL